MKIPFSVYDFFGYLAGGVLLLAAADYSFELRWFLGKKLEIVDTLVVLFVAYVLGHIIANLSSYLIEHKFVRNVLQSPEVTLFRERDTFWKRFFPVFYKPFPAETQERILQRASRAGFNHGPGRALFFHCHAHAKRDPVTLDRLSVFLNLYGFCRNISLASLLGIPLLIGGAFRDPHNIVDSKKLWVAAAALVVSIGMLYRYLKFFRHYTMEVFQTYAELPEQSKLDKD